jgi:DNA-binding transcriptional ArsR family regulator
MTEQPASHGHPVDPGRVARARSRLPGREEAACLASVLTLIADPTRARVLYALDLVEELCVGDLALALDANEDAVSYALRVLRTAGLVSNRKEGRVVYYRLAHGFPQPLREHCLRRLIELCQVPPSNDDEQR